MASVQESKARSALTDLWTHWLKRDHLLVSLGLAGLVALAWLDLLRRAGVLSPGSMGHEMAMPQAAPWGIGDAAVTATMWAVMMAAMMLPSAAPMLLLFSTVNRKREAQGNPVVPSGIFLLGYVLVWGGFSLLAASAQWGLHNLMQLSPRLAIANPLVSGLILVAAGAYQFTPLKEVCLIRCQSPFGFLLTSWREGGGGALQMGLRHGSYCLGCCWVLMALLFVGGVMNLTWIALIAGLVLLEKVVARGMLVSRLAGSLLVAWGLVLVWRGQWFWP
jgi:predicted metal-binding membrane protein